MSESIDSVSDIGDPRFGVRIRSKLPKVLFDRFFIHSFVVVFRRPSLGDYNIPGTLLGDSER